MHTTSPARKIRRLAAISLLALAGGAVLMACASEADSTDLASVEGKTTTTTVAAGETSPTEVTAAPAVEAGQSGGGPQSGGQSGNGTQPGGGTQSGGGEPAGSGQPDAPAPTITAFTTPEDIDCHNGPVQTFTASWSTAGATKVTISIDGPGIYDTYGPSGETTLTFNCSSPHTFLLTAYGADGQTATRSITLQPRNVQPPSDEDAADAM